MGGGSNNAKKNDKSRSSRSTQQRVASKKDLDTFREICQLARIDFERHRETFSTSSLKKSRREKLLDIYADVEHLMNAKRVKEAEKPKNLLRKKCLQYFYGGLEEEGRGGGEEKEKEKEEEENRNEETFEDREKKVSMELKRARVKKPSRFDQSEMGALVEAAGGGTTKVAPPPPPPALVGVPHGLPSFHMQQQQQQQQQMMMMMPPYQMQQQSNFFMVNNICSNNNISIRRIRLE